MKRLKSGLDLQRLSNSLIKKAKEGKRCIYVCGGTGCHAYRCKDVYNSFRDELVLQGVGDRIDLKLTGCHGFCECGTLVLINPEDILYIRVKPEDAPEILKETVLNKRVIERLLYIDPVSGRKIKHKNDIPFYRKQKRLIFGNNGQIDPTNIEDYLAIDGYKALSRVLFEMKPEEVIDTVKRSGLRGRGGGGFLTGLKWEFCHDALGHPKYLICNADEGDPGAYMDRSLLEGNPQSVIEGMVIGAYAIGSDQGYVYVRHEYPLAVKNLEKALNQAKEYGLLGENILGTGFSFHIMISRGAGAFVCGEETALIASIEGRRGMPRPRPPFPVHYGIWGKPTNINNVETFANIPLILREGAEVYSKMGTEKSKGTKVFALTGNINNTGLIEVPLGATLRHTIFGIGGGIPNNKAFKAVQLGGPSGGCIPSEHLDTPIDYDSLLELGAIMGSGGMIVMDETICMVDISRYFLEFIQSESCGKCIPCRIGTKKMLDILVRITEGNGKLSDLDLLQELALHVKDTSLCGLGQTAPNPVLSTMRYFREEYEAHIIDRVCPTRGCKLLVKYTINPELCKGCGLCLRACPSSAIKGNKKEPHYIDVSLCIKCGACIEKCKFGAIIIG